MFCGVANTNPFNLSVSPKSASQARARPRVRGSSLFTLGGKFYSRGVTYGTFRPAGDGQSFRDPESTRFDFPNVRSRHQLRAAGGIIAAKRRLPGRIDRLHPN